METNLYQEWGLNEELTRGGTEYIESKMASQWGVRHKTLLPNTRMEY